MRAGRSRPPVLPIGALPRVDLLPPSEVRRREMLSRARLWVWIGLGALLVSAGAVGGALAATMGATLRLTAEQAETQRIVSGIAALSDVSTAIALRAELTAVRAQAMAGDLAWAEVLAPVIARLPEGAVVTAYALSAGPVPAADVAPADAVGATGTVTVWSPLPLPLVDLTRDLRGAPGVAEVEVEALTTEDDQPGYEYIVRLQTDQSVYTGAFSPAEG